MTNGQFCVHGGLSISVDNSVVTIDVKGPCNTEFFKTMAEKLKGVSSEIDLDNYTALIILRGEALATQEAMEYFTHYLTSVTVKAVAINLAHVQTASTTEYICHQAYSKAGITHQFFYDNTSAIKWLRACMNQQN